MPYINDINYDTSEYTLKDESTPESVLLERGFFILTVYDEYYDVWCWNSDDYSFITFILYDKLSSRIEIQLDLKMMTNAEFMIQKLKSFQYKHIPASKFLSFLVKKFNWIIRSDYSMSVSALKMWTKWLPNEEGVIVREHVNKPHSTFTLRKCPEVKNIQSQESLQSTTLTS